MKKFVLAMALCLAVVTPALAQVPDVTDVSEVNVEGLKDITCAVDQFIERLNGPGGQCGPQDTGEDTFDLGLYAIDYMFAFSESLHARLQELGLEEAPTFEVDEGTSE